MNRILQMLLGGQVDASDAASWRLGFVSEYSSYIVLGLLVALALVLWLVIRSYRREGKNPRGVKITLAVIRIAVIVLVAAALFRPAVVLRFVETFHSTVVFVVDDSLSMSFKDRYADEASRKALAERLGVTEEQLAELSRSQLVRMALVDDESPIDQLRSDHQLVLAKFSNSQTGPQARHAYTSELGKLAILASLQNEQGQDDQPQGQPTLAELLAKLDARGFETNIPAALRDVVDGQHTRVDGIVFISDFQSTTEEGAQRLGGALRYAQSRGMPIFPVLVGDPTPPRNLAVASLQAPRQARSKTRMELTAVLSHRNLAGETLTVKVQSRKEGDREWTDAGVSEPVTLGNPEETGSDRGLQTVAIPVRPPSEGSYTYRARVEVRPDEQNADDNVADAVVQVLDSKLNVLLVSGDAGWEFQYLRDFLFRSEIYRVSVWQQNADPEVSQTASTGMKLDHLPRDLSELIGDPDDKENKPGYDVVILYDPEGREGGFDKNFVELLKTYVSVHGGGLVVQAGNKNLEKNLVNQEHFESLAQLLPVELAPNPSYEVDRITSTDVFTAWPVQATGYGLEHPAMRLGQTVDDNRRLWHWNDGHNSYGGVLPGVFWSQAVARRKPAARVLAVHSDTSRQTAQNEPEPLMAVQPVGRGTVMYIGFDETWRWRAVPRLDSRESEDAYYYSRFWGSVLQYLTSLKARQVVVSAGGERFAAGEEVEIEAEVYDDQYQPVAEDSFKLTAIDLDSGQETEVVLKAVDRRPGRYKANHTFYRTGQYELTVAGMSEEKVSPKRITIELPRAEARRTEADEQTAVQLAHRPEHSLKLWQIDQLPRLIAPGARTSYRERAHELWDTKLWLLLAVTLLTVEWIVRKKYNMA
jgi:hypothetical protein